MRELLLAFLTSVITVLLGWGLIWSLSLIPSDQHQVTKCTTDKSNTVSVMNNNQDMTTIIHQPSSVSVVEKIFNLERGNDISINPHDWLALSVTIYCEARGESWYGMAAVADTIRNRVVSPMFPDTYYGVITQTAQFSCIKNKLDMSKNVKLINFPTDETRFKNIIGLAKRTIAGDLKRMTYNALFYHTTKVHPYWRKDYEKLGVIGNHVFYTTNKL